MDWGQLANVGEGLEKGTAGFLQQYNLAKDRKRQAERDAMEMKLKGLVQGPEGQWDLSPEAQLGQEVERFDKEAGIISKGGMIQTDPMTGKRSVVKDPSFQGDLETINKRLQIQKNLQDIEKYNREQTPAGKFEKSSGDIRQKVGFITSALGNVEKYRERIGAGEKQGFITPQTPLIGGLVKSTPIDEARINMEESIGRLASGGAIGQGEEKRFRQMLPTAADSPEIAQRKLDGIRSEMENKLLGYGIKPQELGALGFDPNALGYGQKQAVSAKKPGGLIPSAQAASGPKPGMVDGGYRFKGGDPANPQSWERVK